MATKHFLSKHDIMEDCQSVGLAIPTIVTGDGYYVVSWSVHEEDLKEEAEEILHSLKSSSYLRKCKVYTTGDTVVVKVN